MGNVIYHNFRTEPVDPDQEFTWSNGSEEISEAESYLSSLAIELDELDFMDLVEAINDPGIYPQLDQELKGLVDGFYARLSS